MHGGCRPDGGVAAAAVKCADSQTARLPVSGGVYAGGTSGPGGAVGEGAETVVGHKATGGLQQGSAGKLPKRR